jgi:tetratricopeptide (TPR) repeat protein/TPR repeat protein
MWNSAKSRSGNEAVSGHPALRENSMLYGYILRCRRERGSSPAALPEANGLDPTSSAAYVTRGNAHLEAGSLDRAIADYSRAIELDAQSSLAYNNRGVARAVAGAPRDAIADYDRAIEIDARNARAYRNRGDAYRERGESEDAIADYTKAIILDPTCAEVYCDRATVYQSRGELDLALADHQKAIALDPDHAAAHLGRGRICARRGDFEQAIASFSRAIKASPKLAVAYNERGHAHLGAQNFARAACDYAKAVELEPAIAQELRAAEASLELRPNRPAHTPVPKPAAHDGLTIGFYDYLLKPNGYYFWLVPFDPASFAARPPQLEAALKAALAAYRKQQPQAMLDALAEACRDPLVDSLRGIAAMAKSSVADRAQNEAEAELHLRAAANAGDNKAKAILGALLSSKLEGIARDIAQAREFAEQAARSNDAYAVRQLAVLLSSGALGSTEPTRAADLMWTAAELGDPVANAMLAGFFHSGTGLQQDYVKAEQYLSRAADLGLTDAQNLLGDLYFRRYYKKLVDTPETGVKYFERALNSGNSTWAASRLVGLFGCDGREAPWRSFRKAQEYIPRCEPYSFHSYHFTLGAVYRAHCDFVTSWAHYNIARHLGSKDAVERLAQIEQLLTQKEAQRALELSQTIEADLKPIPPNIVLQGPAP